MTEIANGQTVTVFIEDKSADFKIYAQNLIVEEPLPYQPSLISPADSAVDIPLAATFIWNTSQDAETYHLQIAENNTFTNTILDEYEIQDTNFNFTLPTNETTYYWRVRANNSAGESEWSEVWSFVTTTAINIDELKSESLLYIYPNPITDYFIIDMKQIARVEIYTLQGKKVNAISTEGLKSQINISGLTNGVYFLKLINLQGELIKTEKIIKR